MKRAIQSVCMAGCLTTINKRERRIKKMFVRKMKWGSSVLLLICLVFNLSVTAFARPETAGVSYEEGDDGAGYLSVPRFISEQAETKTAESIFSVKKYFASANRTNVLPSSYDSRSQVNKAGVPYVLPVRNQGRDGTCWAFSVCSVAETSMIKQNLFQEERVLSPLQFAWFHYNRIQNPLRLSGPDRVISKQNILSSGGNEYLSTFALANWIGLVDESLAPYKNAATVSRNGLGNTLCYSKNSACLENAVWLGSENFTAVKEQIMENGSAMLPFYMDTLYYNSATYGYYCSDKKYDEKEDSFNSNHMVTIVGWDDNYSRENFKTTPQGDGAWLIKNSWGSNWGMDGYFWISYYDKSIYDEVGGKPVGTTVTFLKMTQPDIWDNNYSYDGGGGINWYYFIDDNTEEPVPMALMANIYTAQYEERLSAVSFYTIQENAAYTIYVYCDVDTSISPTGGRFPSAIVSGVLETAGYHTIELPEEVDLSPGMKYTIAIELNSQDENEPVKFLADGNSAWDWVSFSSKVGKGESYYREPGKDWVDVTEDTQSGWYGNFRIHALTRLINKERGDVNADGKITSEDAMEILKIDVGLSSESYWKLQAGDMDQNGKINSEDAMKILKQTVGIYD